MQISSLSQCQAESANCEKDRIFWWNIKFSKASDVQVETINIEKDQNFQNLKYFFSDL